MKKRTRAEIAATAGMSPSHLSNILNGLTRPSWDNAKKLAAIIDVDPETFMERDITQMNLAITKYQYQTQGGAATHEID